MPSKRKFAKRIRIAGVDAAGDFWTPNCFYRGVRKDERPGCALLGGVGMFKVCSPRSCPGAGVFKLVRDNGW